MSEAMFLDEMARRLAQRGTPLAPESALFIALEALETLGSRPLVLSPGVVTLRGDGTIGVGDADLAHDETSVLEGVVETLDAVLHPVPIAVTELAVKVRTGQIITRGAMHAELAAMLVPLNRRAARRMVGRLARDAARPVGAPSLTSSVPSLTSSVPSLTSSAPSLTSSAPSLTPSAPSLISTSPIDVASLLTDESAAAHDTVLDGATLASALHSSLGGRLPEAWADDDDLVRQRARERRNAWLAMAVAVVALVAAVVFLVERVRAAGG